MAPAPPARTVTKNASMHLRAEAGELVDGFSSERSAPMDSVRLCPRAPRIQAWRGCQGRMSRHAPTPQKPSRRGGHGRARDPRGTCRCTRSGTDSSAAATMATEPRLRTMQRPPRVGGTPGSVRAGWRAQARAPRSERSRRARRRWPIVGAPQRTCGRRPTRSATTIDVEVDDRSGRWSATVPGDAPPAGRSPLAARMRPCIGTVAPRTE